MHKQERAKVSRLATAYNAQQARRRRGRPRKTWGKLLLSLRGER